MSYQFNSIVPQVIEQVKAKKAAALASIGEMAVAYAVDLAPVRTSNLIQNIKTIPYDEDTQLVGAYPPYAPYVELGTYKMRAQPYLKPAVEGHAMEYRAVMEQIMKS